MIRILLEDGRTAMYGNEEMVELCEDVFHEEYIVGERTIEADELETIWREGEHCHLRLLILDGGFHEIEKVYRTVD